MMKGHHVRISKEWHSPAISIDVLHSAGTLEIGMPLSDFITAMAAEFGNPLTAVTRAQLERRLLAAANAVTEKMKRETTSVA